MVSVLGIPLDENSSFLRGPAAAPQKIREAFHSPSSNYYSESGLRLNDSSLWTDKGDLEFLRGVEPFEHITSSVRKLIPTGNDKVFILGGDHSITYPVVRAVSAIHSDLTILHIDAHSDLYHDFEGNPHSHASPFARIMENNLATRLIQVGIRTLSMEQREQINRFGVEVIEMKDWDDSFTFELSGPVYLSLDLDAIDPAYAPGVSHHEPGGFSTRQILRILQRLDGNFIGADLVEFNPVRDSSGITGMLTGKLFKEMLELLLRSR
ncbi:MAG: agmatinase [Bacteroidetes bacterium]|nr:agmatinase [Bacteroidota bacterium]